ncbi:MAG: PEP-CTERM sorting domain-containing protein, partial [Acidobacteriaceae bacterium]
RHNCTTHFRELDPQAPKTSRLNFSHSKEVFVKYTLLLSSLLFLTGSVFAGTCGTASLATYASGGFSCNIGDKTYSGFDALLVGVGDATPASLNDITVVPTSNGNSSGFNFNANFGAGATLPGTLALAIFYTGMTNINDPFTEGSLHLTDPAVSGLGLLVAAKAFCLNGSFTDISLPVCESGIGVNLNLLTNITNANLDATLLFGFEPVTELGVLDVLSLTGEGFGLGSASLTGIDNSLTSTPNVPPPIPEPSSLLLLGTGLMSGAGFVRRFHHNRNRS